MTLVYLLFLMFLSFWFSGSEAALTSLSDYRLKKLYVKHRILRFPFKLWVVKPYRIIITILIGNTIVNLWFSTVITRIFKPQLLFINEELKEAIIWLATTSVIIVFCELLPKLVARRLTETISTLAIYPLTILQYIVFAIFSPVLFFVEKKLAASDETTAHFTRMDELKRLLSDSAKVIFERKDIAELFDRVTRFDDVRIKDIFVPKERVLSVNIANRNLEEIINEVIDTGRTRVPVYEGNKERILGYILVKDLFYICSSYECNILDIVHPILKVNLNWKAKDVLKKMQNEQVHIAVVEDEHQRYLGIVTLEDILEEIVGDVLDEYDIRIAGK
ncbi:MAG: CNNM domain-containing protein [Endomicrobia bacterium]|nr:CNNM domain-containing protein [Endomicrobiia bacterium]MCX7940267.1 CNNM domain-containing protein [Endomicrobiia bacterium]MDW8055829.1 CNNM domain-containing protein [Elusimicrobiota bacterium]